MKISFSHNPILDKTTFYIGNTAYTVSATSRNTAQKKLREMLHLEGKKIEWTYLGIDCRD